MTNRPSGTPGTPILPPGVLFISKGSR